MDLPWGAQADEVEYSDKFKNRIIARMLGPGAQSANVIAKEVGVSQPTLSRWLREAKLRGRSKDEEKKRPAKRWTPEEKLRVVLSAAAVGEAGLGALLRSEGLHEADLTRFRQEALEGLRAQSEKKPRGGSADDKRVKQLEKELRRKEKALAEAAAILVLRKKVQALWGEEGEDTTEDSDK